MRKINEFFKIRNLKQIYMLNPFTAVKNSLSINDHPKKIIYSLK